MILHVPHASRLIPPDVRRTFPLTDAEIARELLRMTDAWTDELFLPAAGENDQSVVFPVSRLVVDPERFENDALEPMARIGMGTVYTRTSDGRPLRSVLSIQERDALLDSYYRPHHQAFEAAVGRELARTGSALVVDCHSFPATPLPYETERTGPRPDVCLGTDVFHTSPELRDTAIRLFEGMGCGVALNTPFSGSIVPQRWFRSEPAISSIMVEIRRDLFMDERTGRRLSCFAIFGERLRETVATLARDWQARRGYHAAVPRACAPRADQHLTRPIPGRPRKED